MSYCQENGKCSPQITSLIKKTVESCHLCGQRKVVHFNKQNMTFTSPSLFHTINLDVAGPLPITKSGNKFLLSIVDVYSRSISLHPMKDFHSNTICSILEKRWFPSFGCPNKLVSDGTSYFTGHEMNSFLRRHDIEHHICSPYHPQSNGLVERSFFSIKDMIFACSHDKGKEWDEITHIVEIGLRSTKHSSTGHSPFCVLFGFTPRISKWSQTKQVKEIYEKREDVRNDVEAKNQMEETQNKKISHRFRVDDSVMIRVGEKRPGIYSQRFIGPGKIIARRPNKSYVILKGNKTFIRHEDHLKLAKGPTSSSTTLKTSVESIEDHDREDTNNNESSSHVQRYPVRNRQTTQRYGYDL